MDKPLYIAVILALLPITVSSCKKNGNDPISDLTNLDPTKGIATNNKTTAVFNPDIIYGNLTDQEGNEYKTVTIGSQTWMAENLRTTTYHDGEAISYIYGASAASSENGAYSNYNYTTNIESVATYGRLYNFHAVCTGKLAPKGWHIPTKEEWFQLYDFIGSQTDYSQDSSWLLERLICLQLIETGKLHWDNINGATNTTGFTALPAGMKPGNAEGFYDIGRLATWWTSTETSYTTYDILFGGGSSVVYTGAYVHLAFSGHETDMNDYRFTIDYYSERNHGRSIRCVKD